MLKEMIQCDQAPTGCSTCRRLKIQCSGYRDTSSLRFCHEAASVVRKHKPRQQSQSSVAIAQTRHGFAESALSSRTSNRIFYTSTDELGLCLFRTYHGFALDLASYLCESNADLLHSDSMRAVGFCSLTRESGLPGTYDEARRYYITALRNTNVALNCPRRAQSNDVLMSVLMLIKYERMAGRGAVSLNAQSVHVRGIASLISVRGGGQLDTEAGRILFMHVSIRLLSCTLRETYRIPDQIYGLLSDAVDRTKDSPIELAVWVVFQTNFRLVELFKELKAGGIKASMVDLADELLGLDDQLTLVSRPALENKSSGVYCQWSGTQAFAATIMCRMTLHLLLGTTIRSNGSALLNPQNRASAKMAWQLHAVLQFLAAYPISKPQNRGLDDLVDPSRRNSTPSVSTTRPDFSSHSCTKSSADAGATSDVSSWPSLLLGEASGPKDYIQRLCCNFLRFIGNALDVKEAVLMATMLDNVD